MEEGAGGQGGSAVNVAVWLAPFLHCALYSVQPPTPVFFAAAAVNWHNFLDCVLPVSPHQPTCQPTAPLINIDYLQLTLLAVVSPVILCTQIPFFMRPLAGHARSHGQERRVVHFRRTQLDSQCYIAIINARSGQESWPLAALPQMQPNASFINLQMNGFGFMCAVLSQTRAGSPVFECLRLPSSAFENKPGTH